MQKDPVLHFAYLSNSSFDQNSLHMGTYLNQDALHSMNPVSISKILSHGHVDANMHVPVVYGDWHTPAQDQEHGMSQNLFNCSCSCYEVNDIQI